MTGFLPLVRDWKRLAPSPPNASGPSWIHTATSSHKLKYLVIATFVTVSLAYLLLYSTSSASFEQWKSVHHEEGEAALPKNGDWTAKKHPIDDLILSARANYNRVLGKQSYDVKSAARQYRVRRGRHPPPGFDKWFEYAQSKGAVIVEDFFDRIYHDLNPYWALDAKVLRYQAQAYDFVISVRQGSSSFKTDDKKRVPWIQLWHGLVEEMAEHLPDVDMPVNMMDESRLIVPWEEITEYVRVAAENKKITPTDEVVTEFSGLVNLDLNEFGDVIGYNPQWTGGQYWELARLGCAPTSASRNETHWLPLEEPTFFPSEHEKYSLDGFVSNWTAAKDICQQPHIRGLHGSFIEPISVSTSHQLIPLFGGSKLPINNEILIPPATYLNLDPMYSGGDAHGPAWDAKNDLVTWRGVASGGRNKIENWTHFQRHRFVQMLNGTRVLQAETTRIRPETFDIPNWDDYNLKAIRNGYLGDWVSSFSDVAFVDLLCFPGQGNRNCHYTDPYFTVQDGMPMANMYHSKYLPDIDGNSFSGRYRSFLRSTSLPIKATIYNEWHDDRLFPWVHFVPMDNTYRDIYGILDYFLGYDGLGAHDEMAEGIATEGKEWAEKVLRREDMGVYMYRLLLEWARVCDDVRDRLGWVEDLR